MGLKHFVLEFPTKERSSQIDKTDARCHSSKKVQVIVLSHKVDWGAHHDGNSFNRLQCFCLFYRPTPLGFRQVVQHVRLHVATSELTNYCNDAGYSMTASKVELARTGT